MLLSERRSIPDRSRKDLSKLKLSTISGYFRDTLYSTDRGLALTLCAWRIAAVAHIDRRQYFTAYCCHLHTQPRAHDRMQRRRRDARAFIYPLFICQRARYRRSLSLSLSPRPCRGQIWKVINRPVLERSASRPLPPSPFLPFLFSLEEVPFHASCWLTRPHGASAATMRTCPLFFRSGTRGFLLSRRCESMGGDRVTKSRANSFVKQGSRLRHANIFRPLSFALRIVKLPRMQIIR